MKKQKILDISKRLGLSHIGSCISVLPILEEIYKLKKKDDIVILDGAHSHLAHLMFTVFSNQEELIKRWGIHCDRRAGCDVTGGSLGHGLGIGIGMAIGFPQRTVYVIVTDGSMHEGSNWEALRIKNELKLNNLKIYANFNGYSAVRKVDLDRLVHRMRLFDSSIKVYFTENGMGENKVADHYTVIK